MKELSKKKYVTLITIMILVLGIIGIVNIGNTDLDKGKVNYIMIILTLLVTISSLLYIVKKTNVKES